MDDTLAKINKELTCTREEPITLEVHNRHILKHINVELIKLRALKEEYILKDKVTQKKSKVDQIK